jgi:hypothetical protein
MSLIKTKMTSLKLPSIFEFISQCKEPEENLQHIDSKKILMIFTGSIEIQKSTNVLLNEEKSLLQSDDDKKNKKENRYYISLFGKNKMLETPNRTVCLENQQQTKKELKNRKINNETDFVIKKVKFEKWEDEVIILERERIGNHWSHIADKLSGRTSSAVKNRWYSVLRNKLR